MKHQSSLIHVGSTAALALLFAGQNLASAASVTYTGTSTSGKWNTASNWSPAAVPVAGDDVFVVQSGSRNIAIDLNATYGAPGLNSLLLNGEGSGNITVNSSKTFTVSGTETIASFGKGSFNQNKGTHTTGQLILAASDQNDLGTYVIKKGTLNVLSDLVVGEVGQGVFTQRGGTVDVASGLLVASEATSVSSYTMNKGALQVHGSTVIGDLGVGFLTQSRGKSTLTTLALGSSSGGEGTVNLQGGKMFTDSVVVGGLGTGTFNQSGGTHNVQSDVSLGVSGGGVGSYNLSRGELNVGGKLFIGENGSGDFVQTGGKVSATQGVVVNNGSYSMTDSSLTTSSLTVEATGAFSMSGSTSRIRTSGDVIFNSAASISTTEGKLAVAKGSDINLSVLGDDVGKDASGFSGNYAWDKITLERNVTLSLVGTTGENALYVDVIDLGTNNPFRLDSIIIGNGIDIYYNADNEENRYLAGLSYNIGGGGRLIPISTEVEEASALAGSGTIGGSLTMGLLNEGSGSLALEGDSIYVAGTTVFAGDLLLSDSFAFGTLSESEFSSPTVGVVPEPSTWGLVVLGLVAVLFRRRTMFAR